MFNKNSDHRILNWKHIDLTFDEILNKDDTIIKVIDSNKIFMITRNYETKKLNSFIIDFFSGKFKSIEIKTLISVIIPARNESANIANVLQAVLQQNFPKNLLEIKELVALVKSITVWEIMWK